MVAKTLVQKLLIKEGHRVAFINVPEDHSHMLYAVPNNVSISQALDAAPFDVVIAFLPDQTTLNALALRAVRAVKDDGIVWLCYPKKSGGLKSDITRDHGWDALTAEHWLGVTQISLDDTWSALRFRHRDKIEKLTRKTP